MAYKMAIRNEYMMLPQIIDDYVGPQDSVRVYDAFVEGFNFQELGLSLIPNAGTEAYDPRLMMKLLIYAYSYGIYSSRQIDRACHHNLSFIWLMGNHKPSYRTIARFRSDNKEALEKVLLQSAKMCIQFDLIEGNTLFTDGTKIRANASGKTTLDKEQLNIQLKEVEARIKALLEESQRIDGNEDQKASLSQLKEKIENKEELVKRIKERLNEFDQEERQVINTTDRDCTRAKTRQGTHNVYNAQITVDNKHGLIVCADVVNEPQDNSQLKNQYALAQETLKKKPETLCADAGYYSPTELQPISQDVQLIIPTPNQAHQDKTHQKIAEFAKEHFVYDQQKNEYICPAGAHLTYQHSHVKKGIQRHIYRASVETCQSCKHFGHCTSSPLGRQITRLDHEEFYQSLQAAYKSETGQAIYRRRKVKAEIPFGHIKWNKRFGQFLLRGLAKVKAEFSLLTAAFNITRVTHLLGAAEFITKLKGL